MRKDIEEVLATKGYGPILQSITQTIVDLKKTGYSKEESKASLVEWYGGDPKTDEHITKELARLFK